MERARGIRAADRRGLRPAKARAFVSLALRFAFAAVPAVAFSACRGGTLPDLGSVPAFSLRDSLAGMVGPAELRGRVWVVDFIFTSCPAQCIAMTREMKAVADAFAGDPRVRLVSVTIDPERDSLPALERYARRFGADRARWLFLRGAEREAHELARGTFRLALADVRGDTSQAGTGGFVHSTRFALVDARGRIRGSFDSQDPAQIDALRDAVRELSKEAEGG